jgi:hypothetical protein
MRGEVSMHAKIPMAMCLLSAVMTCQAAKPIDKKPLLHPQLAALTNGQSVLVNTSAPTPQGRGYCARMPYDPVNKVGLVYGACHNPGAIAQNDVWSFDASTATWTELIKTDPSKQEMHYTGTGVLVPREGLPRPPGVGHTYNVICFDAGLGRMVSLRGGTPYWLGTWPKKEESERQQAVAKAEGVDLAKARLSLPWLFDVQSRTWSLAAPEGGDTPRHTRAEACCYDPKYRRVLYWSVDGDVANKKGGVYAYDGASNRWTFAATKGAPAPGIENLCCWDSVNERVLYFAGNYTKERIVKAFDFPSLAWTNLPATGWPEGLKFGSGGATLSFDTRNGVALIFIAAGDRVRVLPYDVRKSAFEPEQTIAWPLQGHLMSYYDPDQNAVILMGGGDLAKTQTWAYRYKTAGVTDSP